MKLYLLHLPHGIIPGSTEAADKLVSVRDGFSWLAFFFTLPWLLWNRLWLWSVLYLLATGLLELVARALGANDTIVLICTLSLSLFIALEAGMLRAQGLKKRGYRHVATYAARDREEAELKFFSASPMLPQGFYPV